MNTKAKICPRCRNAYPESIVFCVCGGKLVFNGVLEELFAPFKEKVEDGKKN